MVEELSRITDRNPFEWIVSRPQPLWLLITVSVLIGAAHTLAILPWPLILGTGPFWEFPRGIVGGSANDMADALVGYLYFVQSPWTLPLFYTPLLGAPEGVNILWVDAAPIAALLGKVVFSVSGTLVNLLGLYLFACFALPGAAMTLLLATLGETSLLAAVCGTVLADAAPFLLWRWGHIALNAQVVVILALALYVVTVRRPPELRLQIGWAGFLAATLLMNLYLFAMVGGCWVAALAQKYLDGEVSVRGALVRLATVLGLLIGLMLVTGHLNQQLASASTWGFGHWSMNLLSPVVPQMSGVIPWLADYRVGTERQYEGFAYLGLGALLLLLVNLRSIAAWIRRHGRAHRALLCVFAAFFLFALSHRVYAGDLLLFSVPLPWRVTQALGAFRSSGRFFWPIGYALMALGVVATVKTFAPLPTTGLLVTAALLQLVDVGPIRSAVAGSAVAPRPAVLDREQLAARVARADAVAVYPTFGCVDAFAERRSLPAPARDDMRQANMEVQLAAARMVRPINSVYHARLKPNCATEEMEMHGELRPGTLYVYLVDFTPAEPPGDKSAGGGTYCTAAGWPRYCWVPSQAAGSLSPKP